MISENKFWNMQKLFLKLKTNHFPKCYHLGLAQRGDRAQPSKTQLQAISDPATCIRPNPTTFPPLFPAKIIYKKKTINKRPNCRDEANRIWRNQERRPPVATSVAALATGHVTALPLTLTLILTLTRTLILKTNTHPLTKALPPSR